MKSGVDYKTKLHDEYQRIMWSGYNFNNFDDENVVEKTDDYIIVKYSDDKDISYKIYFYNDVNDKVIYIEGIKASTFIGYKGNVNVFRGVRHNIMVDNEEYHTFSLFN